MNQTQADRIRIYRQLSSLVERFAMRAITPARDRAVMLTVVEELKRKAVRLEVVPRNEGTSMAPARRTLKALHGRRARMRRTIRKNGREFKMGAVVTIETSTNGMLNITDDTWYPWPQDKNRFKPMPIKEALARGLPGIAGYARGVKPEDLELLP